MNSILPWIHSLPVPALFLAEVVLPLIGFPVSPLWILAGIRSGTGVGALYSVVALGLNQSLAYWLARRWLRKPIESWVRKRGKSVPAIPRADEALWILLIRVTPGLPLVVQNYLLGLAEVRFWLYVVLSLPLQIGYVFAFVSMGQAFKDSQVGRGLLAFSGLAALLVIVLLIRRIVSRRKRTSAGP